MKAALMRAHFSLIEFSIGFVTSSILCIVRTVIPMGFSFT